MLRHTLKFTILILSATMTVNAFAAPPATAERSICRPLFQADGKAFAAGTAFVVDVAKPESRTLLVTATHLFGPDGGLKEQIPATELAQRVSVVKCKALAFDGVWPGGRALTIPGARPMGEGYLKDASAFFFNADGAASQPTHLKLAINAPKVGEPVWLLAQVVGGAPKTQLLHRAVVSFAKDEAMQYQFDNAALNLQATSGAPVLNADGDVVGMNLGGGEQAGKLFGVGNSLASVRSMLSSAK